MGSVNGLHYSDIVELLGEPNVKDDKTKVDASWCVQDKESGATLCVWNYKNGPAYLGSEKSLEDVDNWSVWWSNRNFADKVFGKHVTVF